MSYNATWTDGQRLAPAGPFVRDDHFAELGAAINRRKLLAYQAPYDYSGQVGPQLPVRAATLATANAPPLTNLRGALLYDVLMPPPGVLGGQPATPTSMQWLWPVADGDENKVIVPAEPGSGQVNLLTKVIGRSSWRDIVTGGAAHIAAPQVNELRSCLERLTRGRWRMPLYMSAAIISLMPDMPWLGGYVGNTGTVELRGLAFGCLRADGSPQPGLTGVTVRPSASLTICADRTCQMQLYRCLRPIIFDIGGNMPTWNAYDPAGGRAWTTPGGLGSADAVFIDTVNCPANSPVTLTGTNLATALQTMVDGAEQNFLIRRADVADGSVILTFDLVVEFDLISPPN